MAEKSNFIQDFIDEEIAEGKYKYGDIQTRFPRTQRIPSHRTCQGFVYRFSTAEKYGGKCNLRFDDTNPTKRRYRVCRCDQGRHPLARIRMGQMLLRIIVFRNMLRFGGKTYQKKDSLMYASFQRMKCANIAAPLTEPGKNSPYRDRSVEENLDLFERMKKENSTTVKRHCVQRSI